MINACVWQGRTDTNKRVVLRHQPLPRRVHDGALLRDVTPAVGDYVAVRITEALSANTLRAAPLAISSIGDFARVTDRGHDGCW